MKRRQSSRKRGESQLLQGQRRASPPRLAEKPFKSKRHSLRVVIETPKGRRNKYRYNPDLDCFELHKVLPAGAAFPYDFGFVPGTRADDGDPLDVLVLMDESAFPGTIVAARAIGVIEAEQTEKGKTIRNDRIVAVAEEAHDYSGVRKLKDINPHLLQEIEHFFVSYNEMRGRKFRCKGTAGPKVALRLVDKATRSGQHR